MGLANTRGLDFAQVWEGDGVVKAGRTLLGATKPSESAPGSIRGDYCIDVGRYASGIRCISACVCLGMCMHKCDTNTRMHTYLQEHLPRL